MIERIYIDNFRCLTDFELRLSYLSLLLGGNGTGKSSVFDVLASIQQFVTGHSVAQAFSPEDMTKWPRRDKQRFELDVRLDDDLLYKYVLLLEIAPGSQQLLVQSETLKLDGKLLRKSKAHEMHSVLHDYDFGARTTEIELFCQYLDNIVFVRPIPELMSLDTSAESKKLLPSAANFQAWYHYSLRQGVFRQLELNGALKSVIDGFQKIEQGRAADSPIAMRVLMKFTGMQRPLPFKFAELSDGQRQLIFLYTLLYMTGNKSRTLFIDEADNNLSIREVQPWLASVTDSVGQTVAQAIIISHHPEVIDHLAIEKGIWFVRDDGGPTRIEDKKFFPDETLRPSELEARGW